MTDLEYIEEQIETISSILEEAKKQNYCFAYFKEYNEELHHLQQIKTVLEAWEVVKPSISKEHLEDYQIRTMYGENPFMNLSKGDYDIVKKALEVE